MIELVIGGGQSGADLGGWKAAKRSGILTGGFMPLDYMTEDGGRPEYAELYGAEMLSSPAYPVRTAANVERSDATVFFGFVSAGHAATRRACEKQGKPLLRIFPDCYLDPRMLHRWIRDNDLRVLNVAGNRESKFPGIESLVENYLVEVFRLSRPS